MVPIFNGWFCFGGTEIINNARAVGYAETASQLINQEVPPQEEDDWTYYCDIRWFNDKDEECFERLRYALEDDVPYEARYLTDEAPWHSASSGYSYPTSPSRKFMGAYALSVSSLSDSTREVSITEGILSGGVLGRERLSVPRFRFRVLLTALDEEGLEYGKTWLSKALSEQSCSTHGPSCGSSDLTFFAMCPPLRDPNGPEGAYQEKLDSISRMYHDVKCIEGPITTDTFNRQPNSYGAIVEFTLAAGMPSMFGVPAEYQPIPLDGESIVQDLPYNYIPYPSAELAGTDLTVATNYSTNPSLETNATGWTHSATALSGSAPAGYVTSGRVTGELAASGTSSFRIRLLGNGTAAAGQAQLQGLQTVDLATIPAGARVSATIWSAIIAAGGAVVTNFVSLDARVDWLTAANGYISSEYFGSTTDPDDFGGVVFAARSLVPPPTASKCQVIVRAILDWESGATNTDARLYIDALAVTVP